MKITLLTLLCAATVTTAGTACKKAPETSGTAEPETPSEAFDDEPEADPDDDPPASATIRIDQPRVGMHVAEAAATAVAWVPPR